MSNRTITMTDALYDYLLESSLRETELLKRLRDETEGVAWSVMQISPEQGQFMALLVELIGARRALEIGTFTGYSALCVAAALPADGLLTACDINAETTAIARRYWEEAGVADRIDLHIGPATETLERLIAEAAEPYDFAFIDADKSNYTAYYELVLKLLRPGGLIAIDNVLWSGSVIDPASDDESTEAIRAFNATLAGDERISISMLPLGDGLTLARKRA